MSCDCHVTSGSANSHCTDRQKFDDSRVIKLGHFLGFPEKVDDLLRMVNRMFAHYKWRRKNDGEEREKTDCDRRFTCDRFSIVQ